MIALTPVELYNLLRLKLGDKEAQALTDYISSKTEEQVAAKTASFESLFKKDLDVLRGELKAEVAGLRSEMKDQKAEILKWMFAMFVPFYVGMIVFLIKALT